MRACQRCCLLQPAPAACGTPPCCNPPPTALPTAPINHWLHAAKKPVIQLLEAESRNLGSVLIRIPCAHVWGMHTAGEATACGARPGSLYQRTRLEWALEGRGGEASAPCAVVRDETGRGNIRGCWMLQSCPKRMGSWAGVGPYAPTRVHAQQPSAPQAGSSRRPASRGGLLECSCPHDHPSHALRYVLLFCSIIINLAKEGSPRSSTLTGGPPAELRRIPLSESGRAPAGGSR